MGASSYMIAEGSVWLIKWIQESILIEVLRVVLLEATPVDQVETLFAGGWYVVELSASSASAPGAICEDVKVLVVTCRTKEERSFINSAPTSMVFSSEKRPHGLAFPLVCLSDTPADDTFAVEDELEEHVLCRRVGGREHGRIYRVRYPELGAKVGWNENIDYSLVIGRVAGVGGCDGCLRNRVGIELRLQHQDDTLGCWHLCCVSCAETKAQVCVEMKDCLALLSRLQVPAGLF